MLDHVGIQVDDYEAARRFDDAVLATLGTRHAPRIWPEYHPDKSGWGGWSRA